MALADNCPQIGVAFLETASPAREPFAVDQEERDTACWIRSRSELGSRRSVLARRHIEIRLTVRRLDLASGQHLPPANTPPRNLARTSSRPTTPPSATSNTTTKSRPGDASPPQSRGSVGDRSVPPFKSYINFLSNTNDDWKADADEVIGYDDDDGDEFGLPSLSSMKRRTRRTQTTQDPNDSMTLLPGYGSSFADQRRYSNSADIAVERPTPSYPMPKKSEGKILRPQYKEILRGSSHRYGENSSHK